MYASRLDQERRHFDAVETFDDLPPIYHYWSNSFVRAMLERLGCSNTHDFLAKYLRESARRCATERPIFLSVGSGDGNNELEIVRLLRAGGLSEFTIECLELNPRLIERATAEADRAGLAPHLTFIEHDFNQWRPSHTYHGVVANQSLHHVTNLEGLFDGVRSALAPGAFFVVNDIIGRNGHRRWPEARRLVDRFWRNLPPSHRYNHQLQRHEEDFADWDCSSEGFEGIRSQDVLPLLLERFSFHIFVGFANLVDPFVDRSFGPNFDIADAWDRAFIDRVHACDERGLAEGILTPTHMVAVMANESADSPQYARGLTPEASLRLPDRTADSAETGGAEHDLRAYFDVSDSSSAQSPKHHPVSGLLLPLIGCVRQLGEVEGAYEDGWAAGRLEFTILPERDIARFTVHVTTPHIPADGGELSVEVDGACVSVAPVSSQARLDCPAQLVNGQSARISVAVSATVNLKQRGIGDDERHLGFHLDDVVFEP